MGKLPDMGGVLMLLGIMCAIAGWALIELVLWLLSHVSIGLV